LPKGYVADDLLLVSPRASWINTTQYLNVRAKIMVEQLIEDAEREGMCLVISSGYRSAEEQQALLDEIEDKSSVAKPNESEHQTGLAVDFVACPMSNGARDDNATRLGLEKPFKELPEYKWLQDNAYKYGFEQSYREDNIQDTYYPVESWHWKLTLM
jgi:D-alanyl-D-alanine carboxypeptidase